MSTVSLEDAQVRLAELVAGLRPGEEIVITRGEQPVARVVGAAPERLPPKLGTLKGAVLYMAPTSTRRWTISRTTCETARFPHHKLLSPKLRLGPHVGKLRFAVPDPN